MISHRKLRKTVAASHHVGQREVCFGDKEGHSKCAGEQAPLRQKFDCPQQGNAALVALESLQSLHALEEGAADVGTVHFQALTQGPQHPDLYRRHAGPLGVIRAAQHHDPARIVPPRLRAAGVPSRAAAGQPREGGGGGREEDEESWEEK